MSPLSPFACDMSAIPPTDRPAHHALTRRLTGEALVELRELPDGLAFRFAAEEYRAVSTWVERERLCCPFLQFTIKVGPDGGPVWLRLTGPDGAKAFIRAELGLTETT